MDVVYEGPVCLAESQVHTLLGYQNPLNKFINWNITRTQVGLRGGEGCGVIWGGGVRVGRG
jgi:hypothetical protein